MSSMEHARHQHSSHVAPPVTSVTDPVCGMTVVPGTARGGSAIHEGREYWFCNPKCREKFVADPTRYVAPAPAAVEPARPGTVYTCPMHPQIARDAPGDCPICGMALE